MCFCAVIINFPGLLVEMLARARKGESEIAIGSQQCLEMSKSVRETICINDVSCSTSGEWNIRSPMIKFKMMQVKDGRS